MNELTITLQTQSPLHIGGDVRQQTNADRPMLKTTEGQPYVPATSIKGRLRAEVERVLRSLLPNAIICHAPNPQHMCHPLDSADQICPVCALFGSPWRESSLFFTDLRLTKVDAALVALPPRDDRHKRHIATHTRMSVSINRSRRVAEDQRLFSTELFEPGYPWTFEGKVHYTCSDIQLAPLFLVARAVTTLGGSRSAGLGWCELTFDPAPTGKDLRRLWSDWEAL